MEGGLSVVTESLKEGGIWGAGWRWSGGLPRCRKEETVITKVEAKRRTALENHTVSSVQLSCRVCLEDDGINVEK